MKIIIYLIIFIYLMGASMYVTDRGYKQFTKSPINLEIIKDGIIALVVTVSVCSVSYAFLILSRFLVNYFIK